MPKLHPIWRQPALAAGFLITAALTRLPTFPRTVMDWDESLYFLIAEQWRRGHLPYTTIWDNKPVGIYAIFAVFQVAFGDRVAAIRIASAAAAGLTAFVVYRIARQLAAAEAPALFAGIAYLIGSLSNDGLAANTEPFMAACTALAVWTACSAKPRNHPIAQALLTGLLLGAAFMIKYVAVFEAPAVLLLLLLRHSGTGRRTRLTLAAACLAGAALPPLAIVALYWHANALPLWWHSSILANIRRVATTTPPGTLPYITRLEFLRWGPLYLAALFVLATTAVRLGHGWRHFRTHGTDVFLAAWLLGGCLGIAAAKSFYDHYFLQLLPALCISLAWCLNHIPPLRRLAFALCAAAALAQPLRAAASALQEAAAPILSWRPALSLQPDTPTRMAADLTTQRALTPGALYVFDSQPILYSLTRQQPPTRYVLPSVMTSRLLAQVAGVNAPAELARILATHPRFIARSQWPKTDPSVIDTQVYALLNATLAAQYRLWRSYPGNAIYMLK